MTSAPAGDETPRGRGRPRSAEADEAILASALELADEVGVDGVTIEGVAQRAGVAKTTVYRRWSDKRALLAAALDATRPQIAMPDTGSVSEDLMALFRSVEEGMGVARTNQSLALLLLTYTEDSAFREVYWRDFVEPRRAALTSVIARGQARGEVRLDLDVDVLIDLLAGAIFYQVLRPGDGSLSERMRRVLDLLGPALAPTEGPEAPG